MKEVFVYTGGNQKVPQDVQRVRIDPCVKIIQKKAFENCTKLKYVQFCDGVQEIGEAAFHRCTSLESVRLASTIRIIQKAAFKNCTKLRYLLLNEGLQVIGQEAFENCGSIESLKLPSTMRQIQVRAFRYCRGLREAYFNHDLAEVCANAFQYCTNWRSVVNVSYWDKKNKNKFGHGSLKWIPPNKTEDKTYWALVSSNADHADKVIMANCGMLLPSDHEYNTIPPENTTITQRQDQLQNIWNAKMEQKHQQALTAVESWKKTYFSLQAQYSSLQVAYFQVVAREEDTRRRLQAMVAHYNTISNNTNIIMGQATRTRTTTPSATGPSVSPKTSTVGCQTIDMLERAQNNNQENNNVIQCCDDDGPITDNAKKNPLKRKMPMQDNTNQPPTHFKKLRPIC